MSQAEEGNAIKGIKSLVAATLGHISTPAYDPHPITDLLVLPQALPPSDCLFNQVQAQRVPLPVPFAWDATSTTFSNVVQNSVGMEAEPAVKFENSIPEYRTEFDWNGTMEQKGTLASAYVLCYPKPLCPNFGVRMEWSGTGSCRNLEEE
ncbi:hypothetical protein BYT27DRAFT_7248892 [Phlegmacium glaucopus]|nr:hypothetical protein BYT27DRAFT_7248892 [Phlegmacium glaucopus]